MTVSGNDFADPRLSCLLDYWLEKRGDRPAPLREDIEPLEIPRLLPILHLIDVVQDPLHFRHRLVGTELVDKMSRDVTGLDVDASLYGDAAPEIIETLKTIVAEARPYHRLARLDWYERSWMTMESLELPLLDTDGRVAVILRGATFGVVRPPLERRLFFEPLVLE